jgi:membrane protease YdiL (CAAX protease family)
LAYLYVHHAFQLALALIAVAALKRLVPADYGLHRPRGKSYVGAAVAWGVIFGVAMTLVDYAPQILAHRAPKLGYVHAPQTVVGWLFFEGIYVGPTEEIPFRALLVTYLMTMVPARLRLARFEMSWAGVIVAGLFALLHAFNFYLRPWPQALGQQVYAFALGVLYAYWLEKSRSVLAPAIGHNVGDVVEYIILCIWVAWSGAQARYGG